MSQTHQDAPLAEAAPHARGALWLALGLVALGFAAYGPTVGNRALAHFPCDPYSDPLLDNSIVRSRPLLAKVFTGEFLLSTHGEYRPLGYALLGLIDVVMPEHAEWGWRLVPIAMQVLTALVLFLLLRALAGDWPGAALSAAYLLHPLLLPVVNDLNMAHVAWCLLFSALTLWLFLLYLRRRSAWALLGSVVCFAAAVFSSRHAMVLPALLIALCLHQEKHPRATAAMLVWMACAAALGAALGVPPLAGMFALGALVVVVGIALEAPRERYVELAKAMPVYVAVVGARVFVSLTVQPVPLHRIAMEATSEAGMDLPSRLEAIWRWMLAGDATQVAALAVAALLPAACLALRRRWRLLAAVALAFLLAVTVRGSRRYRDDVSYWRHVARLRPGDVVVELNLATALEDAGRWEEAKEILFRLAFEEGIPLTYQGETVNADPIPMTVQSRLGRLFEGLGDDKSAGFMFFSQTRALWRYRVMKNLLMEAADYCFRTGYLTSAEYCWASGLVLDPYDVRLHNGLGQTLVYRNFFRAARRYFGRTLELQPRNRTALYHMAFVARTLGAQQDYERWAGRWRKVTGSRDGPDFEPIYSGYRFDRERMREWFSGNPYDMSANLEGFKADYKGRTYRFWEVPLAVGRHFAERGQYELAVTYLTRAHETNPQSREALRLLAEALRHVNREHEAQQMERLLRSLHDEGETH